MKKFFPAVSQLILLLFILAFGSCVKDRCGKVICFNKGVCVNGQCACPSGFEGANCDTAWFEKFKGNWHADETFLHDTGDAHFTYDLQIGGSADSFTIIGLHDSLDGVVCKKQSRYEFSIKANQVMRGDSFIIVRNGVGVLKNGIISGAYSLKYRDTVLSLNFKWRN